jgi:hypothetical protein
MTSKQKRKIAQQNGAKAAGSKSLEGIQKSSMNALRHGLFAQTLVLTNESQPQFNHMLQSYIDRFKPFDEVEMNLVDEMVAARWRQQRIWMIQTATIELQMDKQEQQIEETMLMCTEPTRIGIAFTTMANDEKTLELLLRYETSLSRMHDRAMKALQRLQKDRLESEQSETCKELQNDPAPPATVPERTPVPAPDDPKLAELLAGLTPEMVLRVAEKAEKLIIEPNQEEIKQI